jgi:23S rRNA (cytosine1962-C5)-methyltransferase
MAANPAQAGSRQGARPAGSDTQLRVLATPGFADYALVDSGNGRKLERFGRFTVDRPEPQAMWQPALEPGVWLRADAVFKSAGDEEDGDGGRWRKDTPMPETWPLRVLGATVLCRLTSFRHLGAFPEQLPHWEWMCDWLQGLRGETPRVLNLFAYTGAASLIAARAGAEVTHVDASKRAIAWAKQNQAVSKLDEAPIRWILDDARKFVAREVRRGKTYHFLLIDPPKFGRGPAGEVWDVFQHLAPLLRDCAALLSPRRSALVLTTYAIRASALATDALVRECLVGRRGTTESGELAVIEEAGGRLLPTSLFTRWTSDDAA